MPSEAPPFRVQLADLASAGDAAAVRGIRRAVFIEEQGVPESLEIDGRDPACLHVLAWAAEGGPVGTARLLPEGKIGRVAVLAPWRGRGVGSALVRRLVEAADAAGLAKVSLHAQSGTTGFYEKLGFAAEGEEFEEAGIPHRRMVRRRCGP